jgi:hypothetical protein
MAWAGTEVHDPTAEVTAEWVNTGCLLGQAYDCLSDDTDGNYVYANDDSANGNLEIFQWDDTAISDSTIDSVNAAIKWLDDGGVTTLSWKDSLAGSAARTTAFLGTGNATYTWDSLSFSTDPTSGAWSWTDIDALIAGFVATSVPNKKTVNVTEAQFTVYYSYAAVEVYPMRRRHMVNKLTGGF